MWSLGSQKKRDAAAGTGHWKLGDRRDAEGSPDRDRGEALRRSLIALALLPTFRSHGGR